MARRCEMEPKLLSSCGFCGQARQKLLRCTRCQVVSYCGAECQRNAWSNHKLECVKVAKAKVAVEEVSSQTTARVLTPPASSVVRPSVLPQVTHSRTTLPLPLSIAVRPNLVGVLSSHIGDKKRLARLGQCFRSIEQQSHRLAAFFVVWSAPEAIAADVEELLDHFRQSLAPSPLHALHQTRRTSQFYDMRWLYEELLCKEPVGTWLMFTDDDDLWGPQRVGVYFEVISAHAPTPGVTAVCATHKVRPTCRNKVAQSTEAVRQHLASGDAKHCGGVHVEEEFFDFACPRECLGAFFGLCNDETLLHPFADLRFTRFMSEYFGGGRVIYFPTDEPNAWVYYYSTAYRTPEDQATFEQFDAQAQASAVVKIRPEDIEEAKSICKQVSGVCEPLQKELVEMVDLVSSLRQNIDAVLIRHFPDECMSIGEMKRIAVGQCMGNGIALQMAERLARQSCERFGIRLE